MTAKSFSILAALIFAAVALLQLARALGVVEIAITIGQTSVPVMASWILFGVTAVLAMLGLYSSGR